MTKKPSDQHGPLCTTTELSGESVRTLREFVETADLVNSHPFSGERWEALIAAILKDGRFSEFQRASLIDFILNDIDLSQYVDGWDGSQGVRELLQRNLYEVINSHPKEYCFSLEMSAMESLGGYRIDFSPNISFFTSGGSPQPGVAGRETLCTYLSVTTRGLIPSMGRGSVHDSIESYFKRIAFFLNRDRRILPGYALGRANTRLAHQEEENVIASIYLDMPLLQKLGGMHIDVTLLAFPKGLLSKIPESAAELSEEFMAGWEIPKAFFASDASIKDPVGAAMEWCIDSILDTNETVAYLKACIGIEAVLGEAKDGLSDISQRLQDRYAFMIGKNRAERKELGATFKSVLNARGALVHARQRRLEQSQRILLYEARKILSQCINHELLSLVPPRPEATGLSLGM